MGSSHKISFHILILEIVFISMINMNMFFDFVIMLFENHMFKISLNRTFKMLANVAPYKVGCVKMSIDLLSSYSS
jgi:hypothetical protein